MDTSIRTIVAGVSSPSEVGPVLGAAVELAHAVGARLHVVHAFEFTDPVADAYELLGYEGRDPEEEYRSSQLGRLKGVLEKAEPPEGATCEVEEGFPADVICWAAEREHAGLVVVGAGDRQGLAHLRGGTAERVVRGSPAPVLVLRRPAASRVARVLFALDLSDFSEVVRAHGMEVVRALAGGGDPDVRVLLVVPYSPLMPPPMQRDGLEEVARLELGRFLDERFAPSPVPQGKVRFGDPAEEILAEATEWKADLLVLGTHGRSGLPRFFLGSVADAAIRRAESSVLVVPPVLAARAVSTAGAGDPQLDLPLSRGPGGDGSGLEPARRWTP